MKSPQSFLYDEQGKPIDPALAIRRAQSDAIMHALKAMRTLTPKQADTDLSTLVFELIGDAPCHREPTLIEGKKLRFLRAMIKVATQREAAILQGMEI